MLATLVATLVVSGVGAVPSLERADGTDDLGIEWNSLADEAGAAVSLETPGLSCPSGMVLDEGLCKTATTEYVDEDRVCPEAADGYEVVTATGELGESHSCQKTVTAYCTGDKVLHEGQCQNEDVEQRDAEWSCSEGTLVSTFLDPGYSYSCSVTLDPPQCPEGESYLTDPDIGCYESEEFYPTQEFTWGCSEGTLVSTFLDPGYSYSCSVTLDPPQCPEGESYLTDPDIGCYESEEYYPVAAYVYSCPSGYSLTNAGEGEYCETSVSPYCPGSLTYMSGSCYSSSTSYATAAYVYSCPSGYSLTNSGEGTYCTMSVSPYCPGSLTYMSGSCYSSSTSYATAAYVYSCPSGYSLTNSGEGEYCTGTVTTEEEHCSYDPVAGQQCWTETVTETVTTSASSSCPSGYSPNGSNCLADSPTTTYTLSSTSPITTATTSASSSCPSGYSANGSNCLADSPTTTYTLSSTSPITTATTSASSSCPSGYSANGSNCLANSPTTTYTLSSTSPITTATTDATASCPSGYSANGDNCQADETSSRWVSTNSTPTTTSVADAQSSCESGYSANGSNCQADEASSRWVSTDSVPVTVRSDDAVGPCDEGFGWNDASGKCEKAVYSDPTAPLTTVVGDAPLVSCPDGYEAAGDGRCSRTVLGEPTAVPASAGCVGDLGTLGAGVVSRSGTLAAGCVSSRRGDEQSPHWARRYWLGVSAASTATLTVSSSEADVFVYVLSGSVVVASDDDSGAGTDARVAGVELAAGVVYTVEVTTSVSGAAGAFTLTVDVGAGEGSVAVTGFGDANATPGLGADTATVTEGFSVTPKDAVCTATPAGATVAAGNGAKRSVSLEVAEGATVPVTVTCTKGTRAGTAQADFSAGWAPVRVSGLGRSTEAAGGAASVEVSDRFTVVPASAQCSAGPAGAVVTPGEGNRRTVAVDVDAGVTVTVTVKCTNRTQTDQAIAKFAVTSAVGCNVDLGGFAPGTATVHGTISADGGCTSRRRAWGTSGTYHAKRHILRLDSAGWVSVTLESAAAYPDGFDPFLVILAGDADDGSGTRLAANNNHRGSGGLHWRDSRIADRFMPAGVYSIEATSRHRHDPDRPARTTGAYTLAVTVDQTPRADSQPKRLGTEVGAKLAQTWRYQPGVAAAHISTALPHGITAAIYAGDGFATLIAKTTRSGTYDIDITYTNETATHTATTTITATCPTGQIELPGDCATELPRLDHEHHASIIPQPSGYGPPDGTNSCIRDVTSDGSIWYTCRRVQESRQYISKADPQVVAASQRFVADDGKDYGVTLILRSGVILEGCQSVTEEFWQCDHRADKFWQQEVVAATFTNYIYPAFNRGVIVPNRCALSLVALRVVSRGNPQAYAAAINTCSGLADPVAP